MDSWSLNKEQEIVFDKESLFDESDFANISSEERDMIKEAIDESFQDFGADVEIDRELLEIVKEKLNDHQMQDVIAKLCVITGLWKVL